MAKDIFNYNDRLNALKKNLESAEEHSTIVRGPAANLMDYEAPDFFPYATPDDINRITHDMRQREAARDIKAVENALQFMKLTSELIDAQYAYRMEIGSIISPKYSAAVGQDEEALMSLFEKTSMATDDLRPYLRGQDEQRIRRAIDSHMEIYYRGQINDGPLKSAGFPLEFLTQRIHDLRAACGALLMSDTELKLVMLHAEIDFVAVQKKAIDENIVPATPEREGTITDYTGQILGHTIIVNDNIKAARAFFNALSTDSLYDAEKGKFVAHGYKPLSVQPLIQNIP